MISIGVISAFIVYARQFGRPIDELAQIYGQIQTAVAGAEKGYLKSWMNHLRIKVERRIWMI